MKQIKTEPTFTSAGLTEGRKTGLAWERLPDESLPAYRAFLAYLEAGFDRTLRQTAQQLGKSLSLLKRWSSRHNWRARAEAHDTAQLEEDRERTQRAGEAAYLRRTEHAAQIEKIAMAGLRTLLVRDPDSGELRFDSRLKPTDVAALIRAACQLMPTAEPEDNGPSQGGTEDELARLSAQELQLLLNLLPKEHEKKDNEDESSQEDLDHAGARTDPGGAGATGCEHLL